jgi:hypothetical protein
MAIKYCYVCGPEALGGFRRYASIVTMQEKWEYRVVTETVSVVFSVGSVYYDDIVCRTTDNSFCLKTRIGRCAISCNFLPLL